MKIGALIVLYNPDPKSIEEAVGRLLAQVDIVCLIDNSNVTHEQYFGNKERLHYIPLMGNKGIAAAQNIGIRHMKESGMDFVLFSDQDSLCDERLVGRLIESYTLLEENNYKVATIGPVPINKKTGKPYITRQNIIKRIELFGHHFSQMYSVISSFSLTRLSTFDTIGLFDEELFIDGVDNEWGWRAKERYGFDSFIAEELSFQHYQGIDTGLPIKKSSPFRLYYQFRNYFILTKRSYTPSFWKRRNFLMYGLKAIVYPLFFAPRWQYLKSIVKGLRDGIKLLIQTTNDNNSTSIHI